MAKSGVKGTALESVVVDVQRLLECGDLSRDELDVRLTPEDLAVVESKIQGALWYPLDTFGRLTEILLDKEGRGRTEYLVERGRRAAERIGKTGIYSQLSVSREHYGDRVGRVMATLGPAMYRDTEWAYQLFEEGSVRGFDLTATVPAEFPDLCRYSTQGFIHHITEATIKARYQVTSSRNSATSMKFEGRPK